METCSLNRQRWKAIITKLERAQQGSQGTVGSLEWNPGNRKTPENKKENRKGRKDGSTGFSLQGFYFEIEGTVKII